MVPALEQISAQEVQSKYCKNDKNVKNFKIQKIWTNFVTCKARYTLFANNSEIGAK